MRIHEYGTKGENINQNDKKNLFTLNIQIRIVEKREIIIISWYLNGSSNSEEKKVKEKKKNKLTILLC